MVKLGYKLYLKFGEWNTMDKKKMVTIEEILYNEPREIEIPGWGIVKVRDPKVKDRREAYRKASEHPAWDRMSMLERASEIARWLALLTIVEPKIDEETYLEANELKIIRLLDKVAEECGKRIKELEKHGIHRFLLEKKERG